MTPTPHEVLESPSLFVRGRQRISTFASQYGTVVAGLGVARLFNFLGGLAVARAVGVRDFGTFSVGYSFAMLVGQLPNVLDIAFVRQYGKAQSDAERDSLERAHLKIKAASTGVILLVAVTLSGFIASQLLGKPSLDQILLLAIVDGALFSAVVTGPTYFQARENFRWYSILYVLEGVLGAVAVVLYVVLTTPTASGSIAAYVVADGVLATGIFVFLHLRTHRPRSAHGGTASMRTLLRFSSWLALASIVYLVLQRIDVILLARLGDLFSLGQYGGAVRLIAIVSLFTSNLSVVFVTKAATASNSRQEFRDYLFQAWVTTGGVFVVAGVGVLLASPIVNIALGQEFAGAVTPLRLLLVAYAFVALSSPMTSLLIGFGRTRSVFLQRAVELATAIVLCTVMIPDLGAPGAAVALLAAYGVGALFSTVTAYRMSPLAPAA